MSKSLKLEDLDDGRFVTEPLKNKRMANLEFDSSKKVTTSNKKFKMVTVRNWGTQSRYLLIHLFYNVLKEKHRSIGDKLPSINESTIFNFKSEKAIEIGTKLIRFRKDSKTLASLLNTKSFIRKDTHFIGDPSPTKKKAIVMYNPIGHDNVERIFTRSAESIPLNATKLVRFAFVTPEKTVSLSDIDPANLKYIPSEELNELV